MRKGTKTILGLSVLTAAAATAYYGMSELTYNAIFNKKNSIVRNGKEFDLINDNNKDEYSWLNNSIVYDIFIKSLDGIRLHGLKVINNPNSDKWAMVVHGYGHDHHAVLNQAKAFDDQGFNVLLLDNRSFGLSEGKSSTMGWQEHLDILKWIDELVKEYPESKVVLFGVSMGATAVMLASGTPLPSNVVCAIEDCGYNNLKDMIKHVVKQTAKVPGGPFVFGVNALVKTRLHFDVNEVDCNRALANSYVPMLFIHGDADEFVPFDDVFENYYACDSEKELFTVEEAEHALSFRDENYYPRIFKFVDRYL